MAFCKQVQRDQLNVASAMVFLHRYYQRESLSPNKTNRNLIAAVCVFIAAKVRYCPISLHRAVVAYFELEQARSLGKPVLKGPREEAYR